MDVCLTAQKMDSDHYAPGFFPCYPSIPRIAGHPEGMPIAVSLGMAKIPGITVVPILAGTFAFRTPETMKFGGAYQSLRQ